MRQPASYIISCGIAVVLCLGGMVATAKPARLTPAAFAPDQSPVVEVPRALPAPENPDAERRRRLNAKLLQMVQDRKGGRLTDVPVRARSTPGRQPTRSTARPASSPRPIPASTSGTRASYSTTGARASYSNPRLFLDTPPSVPGSDLECLTQAIYYEARSESEEGQAAVAEVVINRSRSGGAYPQSICGVVYQRNRRTCQFTFTCDGSIGRFAINRESWARADRIARGVLEGSSQALLPKTSMNYHANYVSPSWGRRLERLRRIGAHIFYGRSQDGGVTPGAAPLVTSAPATTGMVIVRNEALDQAFARATGG